MLHDFKWKPKIHAYSFGYSHMMTKNNRYKTLVTQMSFKHTSVTYIATAAYEYGIYIKLANQASEYTCRVSHAKLSVYTDTRVSYRWCVISIRIKCYYRSYGLYVIESRKMAGYTYRGLHIYAWCVNVMAPDGI